MFVKLIAQTILVDYIPGYKPKLEQDSPPVDADELGEMAGRLCYLSWDRRNPETASNKGYLQNILKQQHFSVVEHSSASFYIEGVTRAFLLELERHRHLSYSVVSQRYVDGDEFHFVMHPELAKLSDSLKEKIEALDDRSHLLYREIVAELESLGDGRKVARGAARTVLPEGTETRILVTGNLRAWREILWKRLSPTADREICDISKLIVDELKKIAPNTFQDF
jgi:thymidylate synthase (FAD)